jgi:hypothetical protein
MHAQSESASDRVRVVAIDASSPPLERTVRLNPPNGKQQVSEAHLSGQKFYPTASILVREHS